MTLPPESEHRACMEVIRCAILQARVWGWQDNVPAEQLADLMDAVHNIPTLVEHWNNCDQQLLVDTLEDYQRKWGKSSGPSLRRLYELTLASDAKTDSQNDDSIRTVSIDPEVLQHVAHDAINIFVREVLVPNGLIDSDACKEQQVMASQVAVTRRVADNWKECKIKKSE